MKIKIFRESEYTTKAHSRSTMESDVNSFLDDLSKKGWHLLGVDITASTFPDGQEPYLRERLYLTIIVKYEG